MAVGLAVPVAGLLVLMAFCSVLVSTFTGLSSDLFPAGACLIVPIAGLAAPLVCFSSFEDTTLIGLDVEFPTLAALTDVELSSRLALLDDATPLRTEVPPFTLEPVASRLDPALGVLSTMTPPW